MMKLLAGIFIILSLPVFGQQPVTSSREIAASKWVDSVYLNLKPDERIAQLIMARLSAIDLRTKQITFYDQLVMEMVRKYNIGGVCLFQGGPVKQAEIINNLQAAARVPLLIAMDAEWGVGQRLLDSVAPLPKQMMLGAVNDPRLIYQYGIIVAGQCKRMGIHMDFAPVIDVNNNPDNPVINDRSFGENKYKVAMFGKQYMWGLQDMDIMACAKHFPGHGDVTADSHLDLPIITKSLGSIDSLELYPFKQLFEAGVSSTMVAHLSIPSIDSVSNRATSLSRNTVTGLLKDSLRFQGMTFTDALDMQAVKKFFPSGEASVEALKAGNDMLLLPEDIPAAIQKISEAIESKILTWDEIAVHCKKVLRAKYLYHVNETKPVILEQLTSDLNKSVPGMRRLIAENATTLVTAINPDFFPLTIPEEPQKGDLAFVGIGLKTGNYFSNRLKEDYGADLFYFDYSIKDDSTVTQFINQISGKYKHVIIGIHGINRPPANNFGISAQAVTILKSLQQQKNCITFLFGNAYASKNCCEASNLVIGYEDDSIVHASALDMLQGRLPFKGTLPVTVCEQFKFGKGLASYNTPVNDIPFAHEVDSIVNDGMARKAMPGCLVLVAKDGKILYHKAYGYYTYDRKEPVTTESIYDAASMTKIIATTLAVMKLYDEGKISLEKKLGDYLPITKGSDKEGITIEKLLLHEAGLSATISFYKETLDSSKMPLPELYSPTQKDSFRLRVAKNLYIRNDWKDTMIQRIIKSPLQTPGKYVYSDNDFIFLGLVVEAITGKSLDEYVKKEFYVPMGLTIIGFRPWEHFSPDRIVPTLDEKTFRAQELRGDVNDPGGAMFGGVAGHAGIFSTAYDLAVVMQMLLDSGTLNGKRYIRKETIELFTAYHSASSRRGYGFDKPEKDNATRPDPYPAISASSLSFGHTGYTGTCAWVDPASRLVFIFLSNRVYPQTNDIFKQLNLRPKILEAIYKGIPGK